MSAQLIASYPPSDTHRLSVSFRWLLSLYSIIPACFVVQTLDGWFWQDFLKQHLPSSPTHFLLFQLLFGTPHIIASSVLLASNAEYVDRYKKPVLLMTAAVALIFGLGSLFVPYRFFYIAVAAWTVFHVLKQQHGVARGICRLPDWAFHWLLWLSVAAGIVIYMGIFLKNSLTVQQAEWLRQVAAALCIGLVLSAISCQRHVETLFGKCFLWANVLLVVSSFYFYSLHYYFLAILVPRLVHDITAYSFYVTHDYNKHRQQPQNAIYRGAAFCRLPVVVVLPLLSFMLAFILQGYGDATVERLTRYLFDVEIHRVVTVGVLGYLALLHYYTEGFIWKRDSPCRRFIVFSK